MKREGLPGRPGISFFHSPQSSQVAVNGRKARNQTLTNFFWPGTNFVPARPIFWQSPTLFSQKVLRQYCSMESSGDWCQGALWYSLSIAAEKEGGRWTRFGGIPRKPGKKRPKNSILSLPLKQGRDKEF